MTAPILGFTLTLLLERAVNLRSTDQPDHAWATGHGPLDVIGRTYVRDDQRRAESVTADAETARGAFVLLRVFSDGAAKIE